MRKKIFLLILFLIIVGIIAFFIYQLFFKPKLPIEIPEEEKTSTSTGKLPQATKGEGQIITEETTTPGIKPTTGTTGKEEVDNIAVGGITKTTKINNTSSFYPTLAGNGKEVQYYNKEDGKFYKIDENGKATLLSDKIFYGVDKVTWSPQKSKAIMEYPDGANIVYDFQTKKQVTLPKHWENFDFSTDGNQIITKSMGIDPANRWLAVSNNDGSGSKAIEHIGENGDSVYPSWSPNNQSVAMYTKGVDFNRQEVFFLGLNGENFKSTVVEGRGFQPKWSKTGDRLAYSVYSSDNEMKPKLWIINAEGDLIGSGRKNLELETWAEKCTFADNETLYCGVPESLETGAGLFPEMAQNTKDDLYEINIVTGQKKLIAIPDKDYNISNLIISQDKKILYFTDTQTGSLHKIDLK